MLDEFKGAVLDGIQDLRCNMCNNSLSVPPIGISKKYGNVCGREKCQSIAEESGDYFKQEAYEMVARFLVFPCMYKSCGCKAILKFGQVAEHEASCGFRIMICPFQENEFVYFKDSVKCDWKGSISELSNHIEEKHPEKILDDIMMKFNQLDSDYSGEIMFTKLLGKIVVILFHLNKLWHDELICRVWSTFDVNENVEYQITILGKSGMGSLTMSKTAVMLLNPNSFKEMPEDNFSRIYWKDTREVLKNPDTLRLDFTLNGIKIKSSPVERVSGNISDSSFIRPCHWCKQKVLGPAFFCSNCHLYCKKCVDLHSKCPCCSKSFSKFTAYENFFKCFRLKCPNSSRGCTYTGLYHEMEYHEKICLYDKQKCLISFICKIEDGLLTHLKNIHGISSLNMFYDIKNQKKIFMYDGQVFSFFLSKSTTEMSFSTKYRRMTNILYKYQLQIVSKDISCYEISLCGPCHMILFNDDPTTGSEGTIVLPTSVLCELFPNVNNLKFKLKLSRMDDWETLFRIEQGNSREEV